MRRIALLGLALTLTSCADFGDFLGDTVSANPNRPVGDSENMQRVSGQDVRIDPLLPEPGNVWPAQQATVLTLQDLEQQTNGGQPPPTNQPALPDHRQPRPGSSTPPGPAPTSGTPPPASAPQARRLASPSARNQAGRAVPLPGGPGATTGGGPGYSTFSTPQGNGIIVPNGNGTSTVIKPDGTVSTIPTPKP